MSAIIPRIATVIVLAAIPGGPVHERCAADTAMTPAACHARMEAPQRRLGQAGFLDTAARRPGPMTVTGRPRF